MGEHCFLFWGWKETWTTYESHLLGLYPSDMLGSCRLTLNSEGCELGWYYEILGGWAITSCIMISWSGIMILSRTYNLIHIHDTTTSNCSSEYTLASLKGRRSSTQYSKIESLNESLGMVWYIRLSPHWDPFNRFEISFQSLYDLLPLRSYNEVFIGINPKEVWF